MTSGGAWILLGGILVLWVPPALLGVSLGRRARTPGAAFLRGMAVTFVAAILFAVFLGSVLLSALAQLLSAELALALLLAGLPSGLLAGAVSALSRTRQQRRQRWEGDRGHVPLTPDAEAAARAHFNPSGKPDDTGAIRPAGDGVREEGDG